jgi:HNH endonuclease
VLDFPPRLESAGLPVLSLIPRVVEEGKNGYLFLTKGKNKEIFKALRDVGFFDFHVTNGGTRVYLHQIQLYCKPNKGGWQLYCAGQICRKAELEVHHLNHDVKDCEPENLVYVSPEENKLLAECVLGGKYFGKVMKISMGIMLKCQHFVSIKNETIRRTLLHWLPERMSSSAASSG